VKVSPLYDLEIEMDNGVRIEVYVQNGYNHFDEENSQWLFFRVNDHDFPFVSVYNKTIDIAEKW
ncbi:MAG: hypothetical protein J6Q55_00435, partial [Clostridia bacterium]|nr:hypothetical protein [Clostridia bacterium]